MSENVSVISRTMATREMQPTAPQPAGSLYLLVDAHRTPWVKSAMGGRAWEDHLGEGGAMGKYLGLLHPGPNCMCA